MRTIINLTEEQKELLEIANVFRSHNEENVAYYHIPHYFRLENGQYELISKDELPQHIKDFINNSPQP